MRSLLLACLAAALFGCASTCTESAPPKADKKPAYVGCAEHELACDVEQDAEFNCRCPKD